MRVLLQYQDKTVQFVQMGTIVVEKKKQNRKKHDKQTTTIIVVSLCPYT